MTWKEANKLDQDLIAKIERKLGSECRTKTYLVTKHNLSSLYNDEKKKKKKSSTEKQILLGLNKIFRFWFYGKIVEKIFKNSGEFNLVKYVIGITFIGNRGNYQISWNI